MSSIMPSRAIRFFSCLLLVAVLSHGAMAEEVQVAKAALTLQQAADQEMAARHYDAAREKYESILRGFPGSDVAMDARAKMVSLYLQTDQRDQADAAVASMMSMSSNSAAFKTALQTAGQAYRWVAKDPAKGRGLYTQWLKQYAGDPDAFKVQCAVVKTYIEEDDLKGANAALERFKQLCVDRSDVFHEAEHLAGVYRHVKHPGQAMALYEWFIATYPQHEKVASMQASLVDLCIQSKDRDRADAALAAMMAKPANSAVFKAALNRVGQTYRWDAKDPAKGRQVYTQWLEQYAGDPNAFKIQCSVAKTYLEQKDPAGAALALDRFKTLCSSRSDAYHETTHLADAFRKKGFPDKSLDLYRWFTDRYPGHAKIDLIYLAMIDFHLERQERPEADAALAQLMMHSSDTADFKQLLHKAGWAYRRKGKDPASARKFYSRWLENYSTDSESFKVQCAVVKTYIEEDNFKGANAALERFKQLCVDRADVFHEAEHLAGVYRHVKHPDQALALYEWFIATYPQHEKVASMQASLVDLCIQSKDRDRADAALAAMMAKPANSAVFKAALDRVGQTYRWDAKDPAKGRQVYTQWLEQYAGDPEAFKIQCAVVKTFLEQGDPDGAVAALDRFKELCGSRADAYHEITHLADTFRKKGLPDKSLDLYEWFTNRYPKHRAILSCRASVVRTYLAMGQHDAALAEVDHMGGFQEYPDYVKCLHDLGWQFRQHKDNAAALQIYEALKRQFPDHSRAPWIQQSIISTYLAMGDEQLVDAELDAFFADYAAADGFVKQARRLMGAFEAKNDSGRVVEVCSRLLESNPDDAQAIWFQAGLVKAYLQMGAAAQTDRLIDVLAERYQAHPDYVNVINHVANAFRGEQHYARAIELFQVALAAKASVPERLNAYAGMAKARVHLEGEALTPDSPAANSPDVDAIVQRLMTEYKDEKRTAFHVFQIGEEYYLEAFSKIGYSGIPLDVYQSFMKAMKIWDRILMELPGSDHVDHSLYTSAFVFNKLGQDEKAVDRLTRLLKDFPKSPRFKKAAIRCGESYMKLYNEDRLSEDQIQRLDIVIDALTAQKAIGPFSELAGVLGETYYKSGQWENAVKYLKLGAVFNKTGKNNQQIIFMLAQAHDNLKMHKEAKDYYQEFLGRISPTDNRSHRQYARMRLLKMEEM